MVTLRIWTPDLSATDIGHASLMIAGAYGARYISVWREDSVDKVTGRDGSVTLPDDVKARGGRDAPNHWHFSRLDENRMIGLWDRLRGGRSLQWSRTLMTNCFWITDMFINAGQGFPVEDNPGWALSERASVSLRMASLAASAVALAAHAHQYEQIEHW